MGAPQLPNGLGQSLTNSCIPILNGLVVAVNSETLSGTVDWFCTPISIKTYGWIQSLEYPMAIVSRNRLLATKSMTRWDTGLMRYG